MCDLHVCFCVFSLFFLSFYFFLFSLLEDKQWFKCGDLITGRNVVIVHYSLGDFEHTCVHICIIFIINSP